MIILNWKESDRAKSMLGWYKCKLDALNRKHVLNPRLLAALEAEKEKLQSRINELSDALKEFDRLVRQSAHAEAPHTLADVGRSLIDRRLRLQVTQEQLSILLGIHPSSLMRYERSEYLGAKFSCIIRVDVILSELEQAESIPANAASQK